MNEQEQSWSEADELRRRDLIAIATLQVSVGIVFAAATVALSIDVRFIQVVLVALGAVAITCGFIAGTAFTRSPLKHGLRAAAARHRWVAESLLVVVIALYVAAGAVVTYEVAQNGVGDQPQGQAARERPTGGKGDQQNRPRERQADGQHQRRK